MGGITENRAIEWPLFILAQIQIKKVMEEQQSIKKY